MPLGTSSNTERLSQLLDLRRTVAGAAAPGGPAADAAAETAGMLDESRRLDRAREAKRERRQRCAQAASSSFAREGGSGPLSGRPMTRGGVGGVGGGGGGAMRSTKAPATAGGMMPSRRGGGSELNSAAAGRTLPAIPTSAAAEEAHAPSQPRPLSHRSRATDRGGGVERELKREREQLRGSSRPRSRDHPRALEGGSDGRLRLRSPEPPAINNGSPGYEAPGGAYSLPADLYEFDKALTGMDTWPATGVPHARAALFTRGTDHGDDDDWNNPDAALTSEQLAVELAQNVRADIDAAGEGGGYATLEHDLGVPTRAPHGGDAAEGNFADAGVPAGAVAKVRASKPRFLRSLEDFLDEGMRRATRDALVAAAEAEKAASAETSLNSAHGGSRGSSPDKKKEKKNGARGGRGARSAAVLTRELFRQLSPPAQTAVVNGRLTVAAECLNAVCRSFRTYGPLLAQCKAAYDARLALAKRDSAEAAASRVALAEMTAQRDEVLAVERTAELAAGAQWASRVDAAEARAAELEAALEPSIAQAAELRKELSAARTEMKTLESSRRTLFRAVQNNEAECKAAVANAHKERDDHRDKKEIVEETNCRLEEKVGLLEAEVTRLTDELSTSKEQGEEVMRQLGTARQRLSARTTEVEALKAEIEEAGAAQRVLSPRPDWHALAEQHRWNQKERALFSSHSTAMGVRNLFLHITEARAERQELLKKIKPEKSKKRLGKMKGKSAKGGDGKAPWEAATWVGKGTTDAVPRFLRTSVKVKNKKLSKQECEQLCREMWQAREATNEEAMRASGKPSGEAMDIFLYNFLEGKFKTAVAAVEMGYNLMYAMERYIEDADVELAYKVVMGMLPEDMHADQQESVDAVLAGWRRLDETACGTLPKEVTIEALRAVFPEKTDAAIAGLEYAAGADQPGADSLQYEQLFADDEELNQGLFAELLRDQHLEERERYLEDLEAALRTVAADDGRVSVDAARRTLSVVDPSKDRVRDVNAYLARMFGVEETTLSLPSVDVPPVQVTTLLEGLKRGVVKRGVLAPPPRPDEVVRHVQEWRESKERITQAKEAARLLQLGATAGAAEGGAGVGGGGGGGGSEGGDKRRTSGSGRGSGNAFSGHSRTT